MRSLVLALCCAVLALAGCGGDSEKGSSSSKPAVTPIPTKPKISKPPGAKPKQLVKTDIQVGSGATAEAGKQISVQYVGVSYTSGRQFDASWDRGEPYDLTLGTGAVIQGWDQGIAGMKVGGRRELVIPPDLAYGAQGRPPDIAPDETLIFVIDLLSVK